MRQGHRAAPKPYCPTTFRLRRRTPGTFVLVPDTRLGRSIRCQGQLEAAAAKILVACPLVTSIQEQPCQIWYSTSGNDQAAVTLLDAAPLPARRDKSLKYSYIVPDFRVEMASGQTRLIEVKPSARLTRANNVLKLRVGQQYATAQAWSYHVLTERELFIPPLLDNVRRIDRCRRFPVEPQLLAQLLVQLGGGPLRLGDLLGNSPEASLSGQRRAAVLHAVATGRLSLDPCSKSIADETLIYPGGSFLWDPFDSVWGPSGSKTDEPFGSSGSQAPSSLSSSTYALTSSPTRPEPTS